MHCLVRAEPVWWYLFLFKNLNAKGCFSAWINDNLIDTDIGMYDYCLSRVSF